MRQRIKEFWLKYYFYVILSAVSVYYFIFLGESGYAYTNDSLGYLEINFERFPVYTMLFQLFLNVFGPERYQLYVTYFQGLLAAVSVMALLVFLSRQFLPAKWEICLIYLALIMPYGIDTLWNEPRYVYTHYIVTEGITYSLYYLFLLCLLRFLLQHKNSGLYGALLLIPLMCCTRSQLMICYPATALSILYVHWKEFKKIGFSFLLFFCSALSVPLVNNGYHWYYQGDFEASSVNEYTLFTNLIFVADQEDAALIEDGESARLFEEIFSRSYALEYHYDFAPDALIGLSDQLVASHDKIKFDILYPVMREYTASLGLNSEWEEDRVQRDMLRSMSAVLRRDNLGKWLHTCAALVPRALMLSFNPVTPPQALFLCYLYAIGMTLAIPAFLLIMLRKKKTVTPEALCLCAVFLLLMTNAAGLSVSLYALSRYTNYNLGLIYVTGYLCVRDYVPFRRNTASI